MSIELVLDRIKSLMAEKQIRQKHMAEHLGLSESGFSQIMRGKVTLSVPTLYQIAKVLGVHPGSLFPPLDNGKPGDYSDEDNVRRRLHAIDASAVGGLGYELPVGPGAVIMGAHCDYGFFDIFPGSREGTNLNFNGIVGYKLEM